MMKRWVVFLVLFCIASPAAKGIEASELYYAMRAKVLSVKDYTADVKMKIDVTYMKIPMLKGTLYFKAPDKMRLERHGGLSIFPKKNINLTLSNLIPTGQVAVLDQGYADRNGRKLRVLKVIPADDQSNIVLTKIWIDEANMLALRTETTTRNDGTVIMDLEFGNYIPYSLPDKVTIFMDVKDYKLPKGVAMDYNDDQQPAPKAKEGKGTKGTIQITYLKYTINTGLKDDIFSGRKGEEE
jgi:outer membrane lipoprotein-sorting protein